LLYDAANTNGRLVRRERLGGMPAKARPIEVVTSKVRLERCKASSSCGWLIM
jgi:hypothetical protein